MKILAVDIGTHCGYCYHQEGNLFAGTWTLASAKEIKTWHSTRQDRKLDLRPIRLYQKVLHALSEHKLDFLIWEDVQFSTTTLATQLWSSLRGALWMAAHDADIQTECVPVATLKKFATGSGHAKKQDMSESLKKKYPTHWNPMLGEDAIDATWLCLWGQENLKRL